jgi:hypothetical protein
MPSEPATQAYLRLADSRLGGAAGRSTRRPAGPASQAIADLAHADLVKFTNVGQLQPASRVSPSA